MENIYLLFCFVFLKSYSCWVVTDINTNMLNENTFNDMVDNDDDKYGGKISLIYPGTKWCGAGDVADNYEDLGSERETDMCCREHDFCPDIIAGGETKHNLTNSVFYSRLSCDCDNKFYDCLKSAGKKSASIIGNIYFNALQTKCFREEYPINKCVENGGWLNMKCLEYDYNTNGTKLYQWFDVRDF